MRIAVLFVSLLVTVFALPLPSDDFDDADSDSVVIDEDGQKDEEMPSLQNNDTDKDEAGATPGNEGEDGEDPDAETKDDAETFVDDAIAAKDREPVADKDEVDSDGVGENTESSDKNDEAETVQPLGKEGETDISDATQDETGEDGETTEEDEGEEV